MKMQCSALPLGNFGAAKALGNTRERVRLCTHQSVEDAVHEMLIVHIKGTYIRPHKHPNKSESFHIIEGNLDVVVFDDAGDLLEVIDQWGNAGGSGDVNGDGTVGINDLLAVIDAWGPC